MKKRRKVKELKIYLTPMLPTHFSRKRREQIRMKEAKILNSTPEKLKNKTKNY